MLIINKHYPIYKIRQGQEGNIYGKRRTDTQRRRMDGYGDFMGKWKLYDIKRAVIEINNIKLYQGAVIVCQSVYQAVVTDSSYGQQVYSSINVNSIRQQRMSIWMLLLLKKPWCHPNKKCCMVLCQDLVQVKSSCYYVGWAQLFFYDTIVFH